ncbi:MAG: hypothetical protein JWR35_3705 [Marmoricola sp.]|nr:hypothetical protein [Marmoricola sp.]
MCLAALAVIVGGCQGATHENPSSDRSLSAGSAPRTEGTSAADERIVQSPLDAYLLRGADLYATSTAERILSTPCIKSFGFDLPSSPRNRDDMVAEQAQDDRYTYRVSDPASARRYGYQPPPLADYSKKLGQGSFSDAFELVYLGMRPGDGPVGVGGRPVKSPGTFGGKRIPPGGCLGAARKELWGTASMYVHDNLAQNLGIESFQRALSDNRVLRAFGAWSACMATHGYHYADPSKPFFHHGPDGKPTAAEIQTAVADVGCKDKTDLLHRWSSVVAEYDQKALDKNQLQLTEDRDKIQNALKKASVILDAQP